MGVSARDRLVVFAPHPDDEVLGAGALLTRAAAVGAASLVVFLTDGENNPWAQRASERRVVIGPDARRAFGARRRREAVASLATLGHGEDCAAFLGLPDQGLTDLLVHSPATLVGHCASVLRRFAPTHLIVPSSSDLHPDHSAAAVACRLAVSAAVEGGRPHSLAYLIHHPRRTRLGPGLVSLVPSPSERVAKLAAGRCHRSQRIFRGRWMDRFAAGDERFATGCVDARGEQPLGVEIEAADRLRLAVRSRARLRAFGQRSVVLLVAVPGEPPLALAAPLPTSARPTSVRALATGAVAGEAWWSDRHRSLTLDLAQGTAPHHATLFVKLERRFGFFDEAGWYCVARGARDVTFAGEV